MLFRWMREGAEHTEVPVLLLSLNARAAGRRVREDNGNACVLEGQKEASACAVARARQWSLSWDAPSAAASRMKPPFHGLRPSNVVSNRYEGFLSTAWAHSRRILGAGQAGKVVKNAEDAEASQQPHS